MVYVASAPRVFQSGNVYGAGAMDIDSDDDHAPELDGNHVEGFTLGSSQSIDERLEDIKRRPSWATWISQGGPIRKDETDAQNIEHDQWEDMDEDDSDDEDYVPELDDDDLELVKEAQASNSLNGLGRTRRASSQTHRKQSFSVKEEFRNFFHALRWTISITMFLPLVLLFSPLLKNRKSFPLGASSFQSMIVKALLNFGVLLLSLISFSYVACGHFPQLDSEFIEDCRDTFQIKLAIQGKQSRACLRSFRRLDFASALNGCFAPLLTMGELLVVAVTFANFHKQWLKRTILVVGTLWLALSIGSSSDLQSGPYIESIDPEYAILDEPITISVDGQNLHEGDIVAWVSFWGCAQVMDSEQCTMMFPTTLHHGSVTVQFDSVDQYIPCIRSKEVVSQWICSEDIRIRVKDKRGVPGWSIHEYLKESGENALTRAAEIISRAEEEAQRSLQEVREGILQKAVSEATDMAVESANQRLLAIEQSARMEFVRAQEHALKDAAQQATARALEETEGAVEHARELLQTIQAETMETLRSAADLSQQESQAAREAVAKALESVALVEAEAMSAIQAAQEDAKSTKDEVSLVFKAARDEAQAAAVKAAKDEVRRQQQRVAQALLKQEQERAERKRQLAELQASRNRLLSGEMEDERFEDERPDPQSSTVREDL